jgi:hypothetical protein
MNVTWKETKRELKELGIVVNTSLKGCCLGCEPENGVKIPDDVPAIYQLSKRFSTNDGGYLCHQNLGDTALAAKVMHVLNKNGIKWEWDGSQAKSIFVDMDGNK